MRINNNLMAMNTHRQLGLGNTAGAKSMEKLSSGFRINRAGDDAAGLSISEKMRGQIRGLNMASKNAQDGISLIQTAEGALNETHAILQRMRELTIQGANDTNVDVDRDYIKNELNQLSAEVDRIANTTQFNKQDLLKGTFGSKFDDVNSTMSTSTAGVKAIDVTGMAASAQITVVHDESAGTFTATDGDGNVQVLTSASYTDANFSGGTLNFDKLGLKIELGAQDLSATAALSGEAVHTTAVADKQLMIGANNGQKLDISINDMRAAALGVDQTSLQVDDFTNAQTTLDAVDLAIKTVSEERSKLGAWQNRLEHTIKNLDTSSENLQAAESRIRDVDMAKEMMEFTKNNILQQAAQAMLAQANSAPQGVLQLLR